MTCELKYQFLKESKFLTRANFDTKLQCFLKCVGDNSGLVGYAKLCLFNTYLNFIGRW
jgi:hypothetical protein